ncbi:hypothetical protein LXL04_001453 [Taraxacum kok-saghyz]
MEESELGNASPSSKVFSATESKEVSGVASSNCLANFDVNCYTKQVRIMVECIKNSNLSHVLTAHEKISFKLVQEAFKSAKLKKDTEIVFDIRGREKVKITKSWFVKLLQIPTADVYFTVTPAHLIEMFNAMGHKPYMNKLSDFRKSGLPALWLLLFSFMIRGLTNKCTGLDKANKDHQSLLFGIYSGQHIDYASILWKEFKDSLINRQKDEVSCHRFWSCVVRNAYKFFIDRHEIPEINLFAKPLIQICKIKVLNKYPSQAHFDFIGQIPETMLNTIPKDSEVLKLYLKDMVHPPPKRTVPANIVEKPHHRKRKISPNMLKKQKKRTKRINETGEYYGEDEDEEENESSDGEISLKKKIKKSKTTKPHKQKSSDGKDGEEDEEEDEEENHETTDSYTNQYTMYESQEKTLVPDKAVRENYYYVTDVSENEVITTSNFIQKFASELQAQVSHSDVNEVSIAIDQTATTAPNERSFIVNKFQPSPTTTVTNATKEHGSETPTPVIESKHSPNTIAEKLSEPGSKTPSVVNESPPCPTTTADVFVLDVTNVTKVTESYSPTTVNKSYSPTTEPGSKTPSVVNESPPCPTTTADVFVLDVTNVTKVTESYSPTTVNKSPPIPKTTGDGFVIEDKVTNVTKETESKSPTTLNESAPIPNPNSGHVVIEGIFNNIVQDHEFPNTDDESMKEGQDESGSLSLHSYSPPPYNSPSVSVNGEPIIITLEEKGTTEMASSLPNVPEAQQKLPTKKRRAFPKQLGITRRELSRMNSKLNKVISSTLKTRSAEEVDASFQKMLENTIQPIVSKLRENEPSAEEKDASLQKMLEKTILTTISKLKESEPSATEKLSSLQKIVEEACSKTFKDVEKKVTSIISNLEQAELSAKENHASLKKMIDESYKKGVADSERMIEETSKKLENKFILEISKLKASEPSAEEKQDNLQTIVELACKKTVDEADKRRVEDFQHLQERILLIEQLTNKNIGTLDYFYDKVVINHANDIIERNKQLNTYHDTIKLLCGANQRLAEAARDKLIGPNNKLEEMCSEIDKLIDSFNLHHDLVTKKICVTSNTIMDAIDDLKPNNVGPSHELNPNVDNVLYIPSDTEAAHDEGNNNEVPGPLSTNTPGGGQDGEYVVIIDKEPTKIPVAQEDVVEETDEKVGKNDEVSNKQDSAGEVAPPSSTKNPAAQEDVVDDKVAKNDEVSNKQDSAGEVAPPSSTKNPGAQEYVVDDKAQRIEEINLQVQKDEEIAVKLHEINKLGPISTTEIPKEVQAILDEDLRNEEHRKEESIKLLKADEEAAAKLQEKYNVELKNKAKVNEEKRNAFQIHIFKHPCMRLLTGADIVPTQNYSIPSPNETLDCPSPKNHWMVPMIDPISTKETDPDLKFSLEIKRTTDYIRAWAQPEKDLRSISPIRCFLHYGIKHFRKSRHFEYTIKRMNGETQLIRTADLHRMNSYDVLQLGQLVKHSSETKSAVRFHYLSIQEHLSYLIHEFGHMDLDLSPRFPHAPTIQQPNQTIQGLGDIECGLHLSPIRAVVYKDTTTAGVRKKIIFQLEEKHLYSTRYLTALLKKLEEQVDGPINIRKRIIDELKWFLAVRKHWHRIVDFVDFKT